MTPLMMNFLQTRLQETNLRGLRCRSAPNADRFFQRVWTIYSLRLPIPLCTRNRLLGSTRRLIVFNRDR